MPISSDSSRRTRHTLLLAAIAVLGLQGLMAFSLSVREYLPSPPPLSGFPSTFSNWVAGADTAMDPEAYDMLAPDDYLNRAYFNQNDQTDLGLFIAYYKSQHRAKGAHDPKVCLPGSGWNPVSSEQIEIPTAQSTISANQFVISKGALTDMVVYWYQMEHRSLVGSEGLHLRRMLETFSENRTDMALVRVVVPVRNNDFPSAKKHATEFIRAAYPTIMGQFPPRPAGK